MLRSTVLDLAQKGQAQMVAALRRAWYGYPLHEFFASKGWCF
jgi:hypothetical protein